MRKPFLGNLRTYRYRLHLQNLGHLRDVAHFDCHVSSFFLIPHTNATEMVATLFIIYRRIFNKYTYVTRKGLKNLNQLLNSKWFLLTWSVRSSYMGQKPSEERGIDFTHPVFAWFPELRVAAAELATPRRRMEWAAAFAQEDLETLSPGRLTDVWFEMTAFQLWGGHHFEGAGGIELTDLKRPDVIPLQRVQQEFRRIFASVIARKDFDIPPFVVRMSYWYAFEPSLTKTVTPLTGEGDPDKRFALAVFALALLLDDYGKLIKTCPAPKLRSRTGEVCGRWFIGRPNQTYCSPLCQNRATTRASRQKQRQPPQKKKG
jgi:hypothetical protein